MPEELPELFRAIREAGVAGSLGKATPEIWRRFGTECAVLVLDSTGFTRTSRRKGIVHFLHAFLRAREIVGGVFERHGCISWRSAADNLFAEFEEARGAFDAAVAAHAAVRADGLMLDGSEPYRLCIGIGYGRLLAGGGEGAFGDEMNLACKLGEDVAEGDETLLTEGAHARLGDTSGARGLERREVVVSGNAITYYVARC